MAFERIQKLKNLCIDNKCVNFLCDISIRNKGKFIMQQVTNQQKLKPWMGFALFAFVMLYFIFVCIPMQSNWGIWGLVATEVSFLIIAIVYGLIFKIPLKEMFPVRKFTARDFFGSLFLVVGGSLFGLISIALVGTLIPSSVEGSDVSAISEYISNGPGYIILVLVMALSPAICEEAIHRGAILTNFRSIKKEWVVVLIMAIFFGLNHLSVLRFINTAILGAALSYIVIKKNNILLSSMMHFILNFSASSISYISSRLLKSITGSGLSGSDISNVMNAGTMKTVLGTYLLYGTVAPFLIVLGLMLLNPAAHKKIRFLFAGIVAVICLVSSVGMTAYNTMNNKIATANFSYTVVQENVDMPGIDVDIEKEGNYAIVCVLMKADGEYTAKLVDENGNVVSEDEIPEGSIRTLSVNKQLEPGHYQLIMHNGKGSNGDTPVFSVQVNKV